MDNAVRIEPVPPSRSRQAIRFVAAGGARGDLAEARLTAIRAVVDRAGPDAAPLWWAQRRGRCVAAAMVIPRPGRTGMLLRCPTDSPGVDVQALAAVLRSAVDDALGQGLAMVQAFVRPEGRDELPVLEAAGLKMLVELVYMRLDLPNGAALPADDTQENWTFRSHGDFADAQLAELIWATYEGSLDCPALCGVRRMEDVLASHRGSGVFRPQWWWLFYAGCEAAGCVLVNGSRSSRSSTELVYLGVRPRYRGRGLGRHMLRHASREVARDGLAVMNLAVDGRNAPALRIYEAQGFCQTDQMLVMARLRAPCESDECAEGVELL